MKKLLLTEPFVEYTDRGGLDKLKGLADFVVAHDTNEATLVEESADADGIFCRLAKVTAKVIVAGRNLRVIGKPGVGTENIDLDTATANGVMVVNVPMLNADSVAEHTIGLALSLTKSITVSDRKLRAEGWRCRDDIWPHTHQLNGKTFGIVGLGNIGSRVALLARAFGCRVLAYDPYISDEKAKGVGAVRVDLKTLLSQSDVVTVNSPLTEETHHLIDGESFKLMKKTAILVNTGRGPVIDERSLLEALGEKTIAGIGLDVFEEEPLASNNPLLKFENVVMTPHLAGLTYEVRVKSMELVFEDMVRAMKGERPVNLVNPSVLSHPRLKAARNS